MEFRLLGPVQAHADGRALALGGPRQRALLAVLLLNANEIVTADRLIDEVWGETAPATVTKSVQVYVVAAAPRDGRRAARHARAGLPAARRARGARPDPVRGPRARGRGGSPPSGPPRSCATPSRCGAARRWPTSPTRRSPAPPSPGSTSSASPPWRPASTPTSSAASTAGLTGELEALVAEHPLRERLRGRQMLALYRARSPGGGARGLRDGPGDARRRARHRARAAAARPPSGDPRPGRGPRPPRRRPPRPGGARRPRPPRPPADRAGPRVRRPRARARPPRRGARRRPRRPRPHRSSSAGEPGIGKSRLVEEPRPARATAARACSSGAAGRRAARRPTGRGSRPCAATSRTRRPWRPRRSARAPGSSPRSCPSSAGCPRPPGARGTRRRGSPLPAVRGGRRLARGTSRGRPGRARARRPARRRRPVAAPAALRRAADRRPLRLLVVGAYRDVDPTLREPLGSTLAQLVREPRTVRLALAGLGRRRRRRLHRRDDRHRAARTASRRRSTPRPRATRCSSARSYGCWRRGPARRPRRAPAHPAGRARGHRRSASGGCRRLPRRAGARVRARPRVRRSTRSCS